MPPHNTILLRTLALIALAFTCATARASSVPDEATAGGVVVNAESDFGAKDVTAAEGFLRAGPGWFIDMLDGDNFSFFGRSAYLHSASAGFASNNTSSVNTGYPGIQDVAGPQFTPFDLADLHSAPGAPASNNTSSLNTGYPGIQDVAAPQFTPFDLSLVSGNYASPTFNTNKATGTAAFASSTTYTIQTGNFNAEQTRIPGGGFAGSFNNSSTEVGLYAHGGSGGTNESAFETFSTTGTTSGTVRPLQTGDSFSLTLFSATNPFAFAGVYFDDNTTYSSYSNYNTNERTAVVLGSSGNWVIHTATGNVDTGIGANVSITVQMTVTSSNTFNMTINGTTYYDLTMEGSPGATAHVQSFSLAVQNDNSANFYVKNGSLTNSGAVTFGGTADTATISGVIADGLDAGSTSTASTNSLTKIGTGTITLSGANTYSGATNINGGTLSLGVAQNGTTSGPMGKNGTISFGGGTLQFSSLNTTDYSGRFSTVAGQAYSIDTNGQNVSFATGLAPTSGGSLTKIGTGTLTLSGANTYSGATSITGGTLALSGSGSLANGASGSAINVSSGAVLDISGTTSGASVSSISETGSSNGGSVKLGSKTLTINGGAASTTYQFNTLGLSGDTGSLVLAATSTSTLRLYGASQYTGTTTLNSGTLAINDLASSSAYTLSGGNLTTQSSANLNDAATVTVNTGTFTVGSNDTIGAISGSGGTISLGASTTLTTSTASNTSYTGLVSGSGALTKSGAGTLTLQNTSNSYGGGTTVSGGTLNLGAASSIGTGGLVVSNTGTFDMRGFNQTVTALGDGGTTTGLITSTLSGTSTLTVNDTGTDSFGGQIADNTSARKVALTKTGTGTLTLSNSNAFSGGVTLSGGTLTASNTGALGTGTITAATNSGTTLNLRSNADGTFGVSGLTVNSGISTTLSVDQLSTGNSGHTLTLGGAVSLANGTTLSVSSGNSYVLSLGAVSLTGSSTPSTTFSGAGTTTLASLAGSSSATTSTANFNNSGTFTIAGNVSNGGGALSLSKGTSAGTLVLQGTGSNYSGSTAITNGTIRTAVATNGFGNTTGINIGANGILDLRNDSSVAFSNGTTNYAVSTTGSGATINVDNNNSAVTGNTLTIGALSLGAHTLNITGAHNYSLALGPVSLTGAGTISANSANVSLGAVSNGGNRLTIIGSSNTTLGGAISGAGDLLKQGTGTLTFSSSSPTWAPTTASNTSLFVDSGTIVVGSGADIGVTNGTTTGRIALGASNTNSAGDVSLLLNTAGTTLANPIDSRFFTGVTGGKTIGGTNTSGAVTYSGGITLHDNTTLSAANGGTVAFSGVIATGTAASPYASEAVNTASPTGGFSAGPGVIINSGASSTGIVEYDNAMTYSGETIVNSGTLQFNASGSLANSTIRLGVLGAATLNMSAPGGTSLPVTINVRPSSGAKTISAANTSGIASMGGHFALDDDVTVTETSATGTLAITQGRSSASDTLTGTDIKNHTLTFSGAGNYTVGASTPTGFGTIYNSTGSGNVLMSGSGTLSLIDSNTYSGTTTISSGTLQLGNGGTAGSLSASSVITNNGVLAINRSNAVVQGTDFSGGAISGNGSFAQVGSGTTTLSAANTYSGGTTAAAGTLLVSNGSGSGTGTGAVAVNNSGTLGGTGTISGATTVNPGGNITGAANGSVGTLTLSNNVTFSGASGSLATYLVDLTSTSSDKLAIGGNLNLSSAFDQITFQGTTGASSYTLATYAFDALKGTSGDSFDNVGNLPSGYSLVYTPTELDLVVTPVPEPSTWVAAGLAFGAMALSQRRRIQRLLKRRVLSLT